LQKEGGIEVEGLKVEIENMEEVGKTKAAIHEKKLRLCMKRYTNQKMVHEKVVISNINFEMKKAVAKTFKFIFI
jgi:hypothetical protein